LILSNLGSVLDDLDGIHIPIQLPIWLELEKKNWKYFS
jgi:hypothetical protein